MFIPLDEDECKTGKAKCGANTLCRNTRGSYACDCKPGYVKKGDHCIGMLLLLYSYLLTKSKKK